MYNHSCLALLETIRKSGDHLVTADFYFLKGTIMSSNRRKAGPSAKLILINGKSYEKERGRQVTRYRFSETTLRRISRRKALRQGFLTELEEEVAELGWLFFRLGPDYAVIDLTKSSTWTKLTSVRVKRSLACWCA